MRDGKLLRRLSRRGVLAPLKSSMLRFGLVGVANTTTDILVFLALTGIGRVSPTLANVVSYSTGLVQSFLLNKKWTFKNPAGGDVALQQFIAFATVSGCGLVLSTAVVYFGSWVVSSIAAKCVSVPVVFLWNYAMSRRVFRRKVPNAPKIVGLTSQR